MQQAVIVARAKSRPTGEVKGVSNEEDKLRNFSSERLKYQNFWIGVNRGINIDSKNPKLVGDPTRHKEKDHVRSKNLFNPLGRYKLIWDVIITALILYSVVMIPVRIAFEPAITPIALIVEYIIMIFFLVDIIANFNTTYVDPETEKVIQNRQLIALNYFKAWFWIDALSTFPFDLVANAVSSGGGSNTSALRAIRALRLFRIFKLFRISKFHETMENFRLNPHIVNLTVLMLSIFFIAHVFACVWHFIALSEQRRGSEHTWVDVLGFSTGSIYDRYVASLYYVMVTMMTIGYGDIRPVNDNERIFAIGTMLTGGVVFGAMISRLASILEKRNPEAKALSFHMAEFKSYLVEISLPLETKKRAVDAYYYYLTRKSAFGEPSFFEKLPQPILYRLVREMNGQDIRCVRLFHTYEMDFVVPLLLGIKPFHAAAGEVIFEEGDVCNSIVFIKKGKVALTSSDGFTTVLAGYARAGGYFGDMEYLRNTTCIATYAASKQSDLLSVSHSQIALASARCLEGGVRFRKENEVRYALFNQVLRGNRRVVSDETVQLTLDESRVLVNTLMKKSERRSSVRRRSTLGSSKPRKSMTASPRNVQSLWVDGTIVDSKRLNLLAHNMKPIFDDNEEEFKRVIYTNEDGSIVACDVSPEFIAKRFVIDPMHPSKVAWDLIILILVAYSLIAVPVEIAFNRPLFDGSKIADYVTDAFFLLDIVLTLRTGYFEDNGDHLVIVPHMIIKQYVTTWFLPDLLGSLPVDDIVSAAYDSGTNLTFTKLLKVIRLVRLLKLMKLLKLGYLTEILEDRLGLSPAAMNLAVMLLQVFFVGHLVACILYGVSGIIVRDPWWSREVPSVHGPMTDATLASKYVLTLYWTFTIMSTVGYGDIYPETTPERILNIFIILIGASMFGYMIANVSGLIQSLNSSEAAKDDQIASITEYLDEKQCPTKLQLAVIKHFRNYYKRSSPFDVDTMLARLPERLANEILLLHHQKTMENIAVLHYVENVTIRLFIFNLMKPVYYEPNELLVKQGSSGSEILFLVDGKGVAFKKVEAAQHRRSLKRQAGSPTVLRSANSLLKSTTKRFSSFMVGSTDGVGPADKKYVSSVSSTAASNSQKKNLSTLLDDFIPKLRDHGDKEDVELVLQSPPPPLPGRNNRFNLSVKLTGSLNYDSDSDQDQYEALRNDHSPVLDGEDYPFDEEQLTSPAPGPSTFGSELGMTRMQSVGEVWNGSDADSDASIGADGLPHKFDPSFTWTEKHLLKAGLTLVGEISPGEFVGHLSLMYETVNLVTVAAAAFSTVYTLNKQDISPLLIKDPTVSIHLQMALSRAISAQADLIGKFHMRQSRARFLTRAKVDYYSKLDVQPGEVNRIRRTYKNKMKRIASRIKFKFAGSFQRQQMTDSFSLNEGSQNNHRRADRVDITADGDEEIVAETIYNIENRAQSVNRLFGGFHFNRLKNSSHNAALSLAARVRRIPRSTKRKVIKVEKLLNKYSVLYESDEEKKSDEDEFSGFINHEAHHDSSVKNKNNHRHRIKPHRTPLPASLLTRSAAQFKPPLLKKRRTSSFTLITDSSDTRPFVDRLFSRFPEEPVTSDMQLNRIASLNDLDELDNMHRFDEVSDVQVLRVLPLWTNRRALNREPAELRGRRQSFPSLELDLWKINGTNQGLL